MARNGVELKVRMSGTGDAWFTEPVVVPDGLYFRLRPRRCDPHLGDSAITETFGIGGFPMAAATAIVRFVGGSPAAALAFTRLMGRIRLARNPSYAPPPLGSIGSGSVSVGFGQSRTSDPGHYRQPHRTPVAVQPRVHCPESGARRRPDVQLTPRESEKLLVFVAADVARRRRARGLRLNLPEAVALISEAMIEGARDGRSVAEVMALARHVLSRDDVMAEVPEMLDVVQIEATFRDGTKLVSCHDPIP